MHALLNLLPHQPLPENWKMAFSSSTAEILSRTDVKPVDTRVAQQVRNNLLFFYEWWAAYNPVVVTA